MLSYVHLVTPPLPSPPTNAPPITIKNLFFKGYWQLLFIYCKYRFSNGISNLFASMR